MARSRFYRSWLIAAALVAASPAFAQFGSIFRDDGPPRPPANVPEAPPYYSPQRQSPPSQQPYYPSRGDVPPPPQYQQRPIYTQEPDDEPNAPRPPGSVQRGDVPPAQALDEIRETVERATALANQMLSLAKIEQLRQQPESEPLDLGEMVRQVALDLSPLIADRSLDFELDVAPARVDAHRWMLLELSRNLLHNAIKHSPVGSPLSVHVAAEGASAVLRVRDAGPGISAELRQRLFAPFAAGDVAKGSGLGLAICREIVQTLGGEIALDNRVGPDGRVLGLDAVVRLPLATPPHPAMP